MIFSTTKTKLEKLEKLQINYKSFRNSHTPIPRYQRTTSKLGILSNEKIIIVEKWMGPLVDCEIHIRWYTTYPGHNQAYFFRISEQKRNLSFISVIRSPNTSIVTQIQVVVAPKTKHLGTEKYKLRQIILFVNLKPSFISVVKIWFIAGRTILKIVQHNNAIYGQKTCIIHNYLFLHTHIMSFSWHCRTIISSPRR